MNGNFLLDTNIIIALFGGDTDVMSRLQEFQEIYVPSVVLGELYYGARKSTRIQENLERVDEFASGNAILPCDVVTASYYGELKTDLRKKGKPIPENDIWIAALAVQHDLVLVSRDAHFSNIKTLKLSVW